MRILGIDPGLRNTGYGIIDLDDKGNQTAVAFGVIKSKTSQSLSNRLETIYRGLEDMIKTYTPEICGIEEVFSNKNPKTTLLLGHVRGVLMLCAHRMSLPVFEYSAKSVKSAVTGNGNASKEQIQFMIQRLLKLEEPPKSPDAADALAVAVCHINKMRFSECLPT